MKLKRLFGWILLISGLAIIFGSLYFSYAFFTLRAEAPEIFKIEEKQESISSSEDLEEKMEQMVEEQIKNMIPPEITSKFLNLISWSVFAGILIFGGSRISGIGIKLIRREL